MRYIVLSSEQACMGLSRALWRLAVPEPVKPENDPTLYLYSWVKHPTSGQWAMFFDDSFVYKKHADVNMMLTAPGDPYGSQAMMQSLFLPIAANGVASLQALLTYSLTHDVIDTAQVLPHVNPALVKTKAEMDADGWFPAPVMP